MQDGPTISNLPEGHNLTVSKVEINVPAPAVTPGSPLVKVLIKYPSDWKKDKFFKDGDVVEVSPESAATFVEIGIATMVNPDEAHADDTDTDEEDVQFNSADPAPVAETKKGKKNAGK